MRVCVCVGQFIIVALLEFQCEIVVAQTHLINIVTKPYELALFKTNEFTLIIITITITDNPRGAQNPNTLDSCLVVDAHVTLIHRARQDLPIKHIEI